MGLPRDLSIKIRNYKCFGDEPQGFDEILPINVIVGKNNSGKSSLVEAVQYAVRGFGDDRSALGRAGPPPRLVPTFLVRHKNVRGLRV